VDRRSLWAAYDRSAARYDDRFRALQREKFRAAAPFLSVPPGALCLDAGGGTGLLAEWAREEAPALAQARWLLLDASDGMLREARARVPLRVRADLAALPLRAASFPLVCAFTSLLGEVDRPLAELLRCVAPGGQLAVSFLRGEAPGALSLPGARVQAARVAAGQDVLFVLRKE
jgi:ubiquinone/menaquinone biosynthesis C-methylase UbiE